MAELGRRRLRAAEAVRRSSQAQQQQAHYELGRLELERRVREQTAELTRANQALQEAVLRYELADAATQGRSALRQQLETDLRRAVELEEELVLYYQPIVALASGRIVGFESLIRWRHPVRGLVVPAEFIPLAEETGLIVPIGRWALREACRRLCEWQRHAEQAPPLMVSVNLSGRQLAYPRLVDDIEALLHEFQPAPGTFRCEITESVIMDNPEQAIIVLGRLRELMIPLSVDDFGTGYSSLSYLQRFPITTLKIDRSFVIGMSDSHRDLEIVRAIAALAHTLGLDVIVEGIETREQLAQLRDLHCEYGQGFLFSPPLDSEAVDQLLASRPEW